MREGKRRTVSTAPCVDRWDLKSWWGIGGDPTRVENRRTEKTALALGRGAERSGGRGTRFPSSVGFLVEKRGELTVPCEADMGNALGGNGAQGT